NLLERLQEGIKSINPETALLCELFGPVFVKTHDFQCDYYPFANLFALLRGEITPYEFGEWLRDYWAVMPPSAVRVSFTETHDTRKDFSAYAWRGSKAEKAMYAILIMAGFVPMMWSGQEVGAEDFYRRILSARSQSQAILFGERQFNAVACDNPHVLSIIAREGEERIWGVVSLYAERTPLTFDLTSFFEIDSSKIYRLHDLIAHQEWNEYGQREWTAETLRSVTLSLVPFMPYFFEIVS
ncbi:MAG: hypothetical protein GTO14_00830, partial [Anaerolineales bacterium]|nr:hypothetical protein [Anaerolineales bacterium]